MMKPRHSFVTGAAILILTQLFWIPVGAAVQNQESNFVKQQFLKFPIPNQTHQVSDVKYLMRAPEYTTYFTTTGMILAGFTPRNIGQELPRYFEMQIQLQNILPDVQVSTLNPKLAKPSRFANNEAATWLLKLPNYAGVKYANLYPDIDMICFGKGRQLEFEFVIAPGGDPRKIQLRLNGAERVELTREGALLLHIQNVAVELPKPMAYQAPEDSDARYVVNANYVMFGKNQVGFQLGRYDSSRTLVIDR